MDYRQLLARGARVCALISTIALSLAACSKTIDPPFTEDMGPVAPMMDQNVDCVGTQAPVTYYVDTLLIPTEAQAMTGQIVGFDLDGVDGACGLDDWAGQVDNALIDLAGALPSISPDIDLQSEISDGLCGDAMNPPTLALEVIVEQGMDCANITIRDGTGSPTDPALAGPFGAGLVNGVIDGAVASLALTIPYESDTGQRADISLSVEQVRFRGTIGANGLENVIIGGQLPASALEQTIMDILPILNDPNCEAMGNCITFGSIAGILSGLYDIPAANGACGAAGSLSVGLLATADTDPTPPACPAP